MLGVSILPLFLQNFVHGGQQSKLSGVFTDKIIQYLQIKLCTGVYILLRVDCFESRSESFHRVGNCYVGGQLIPIPGGSGEKLVPVCIV